jgi:hypothetical protein
MTEEYADLMRPLLPLARKAYGSRDTVSVQHDASREYTRLAIEYYSKGGSLLKLADALGVTYAGLRRRILTDDIRPKDKRTRSKATAEEISSAVTSILFAKGSGDVENYHETIRVQYEDKGISLSKIAKAMGLSSANPLYYAVAKTKIKQKEIV